jgi:hypothetical protein
VKLRSLLLTTLIRVPSTASNSRPNIDGTRGGRHYGCRAESRRWVLKSLQVPQQLHHLDIAVVSASSRRRDRLLITQGRLASAAATRCFHTVCRFRLAGASPPPGDAA